MDEQRKLRTCFSLKTASDVRTSYSPRSWTSPGTREKATKYQRDKWSTGYTSDRGVMVTVTHPHPGCVRKHTPKCCGFQGRPVTRPVGRRRTSPRGEVGDEARLGDGRTGPPPGPPAERGGGGTCSRGAAIPHVCRQSPPLQWHLRRWPKTHVSGRRVAAFPRWGSGGGGVPAGRGGRAVAGEAAPSATATGNPRARLPPLCKDPPKVASVTLAQEHV